jgi:hypothetical protein
MRQHHYIMQVLNQEEMTWLNSWHTYVVFYAVFAWMLQILP